ncbi:MAG: hypothetical protein ACRC7C_04535 [Beijerinckiaceae bacterium]
MSRVIAANFIIIAGIGSAQAHPHGHSELPLMEMLLHMARWEHLGLALLAGVVAGLTVWTLRGKHRDRKV